MSIGGGQLELSVAGTKDRPFAAKGGEGQQGCAGDRLESAEEIM